VPSVINNITVHVQEVTRCNGDHIEHLIPGDKSPCSGLSFCMLVSSIVIEIKILLIGQILDHFICQPVHFILFCQFNIQQIFLARFSLCKDEIMGNHQH
jgi:hypothetical protein